MDTERARAARTALTAGADLAAITNLRTGPEPIGTMFMLHSIPITETHNDLQNGHAKPYHARSSSRRSDPPPLPSRRSGSAGAAKAHTVRSRCSSPVLALTTIPWK